MGSSPTRSFVNIGYKCFIKLSMVENKMDDNYRVTIMTSVPFTHVFTVYAIDAIAATLEALRTHPEVDQKLIISCVAELI